MTTLPTETRSGSSHRRRSTPPGARGEPQVWLMGMTLVLSLVMILIVIGVIVREGTSGFWPKPIDLVTLESGETFLGLPINTEDGPEGERRRYRVGNRDLGQQSFRWVQLDQIERIERPSDALLVERTEWGVFLGTLDGLELHRDDTQPEIVAETRDETWAVFNRLLPESRERTEARRELADKRVPKIQRRIVELRLRERTMRRAADTTDSDTGLSMPVWIGITAISLVCLVTAGLGFRGAAGNGVRTLRPLACVLAIAFGTVAWVESPWRGTAPDPASRAEAIEEIRDRIAEYEATQSTLLAQVAALDAESSIYRLILREAGEQQRLAPRTRSEPDDPMQMSQVVRVVRGNDLSFADKLGVYFSRWWEYLSAYPRENASEGGVFPVIVGTVTLTLLLTVSVVPLGVIAALYLREYARQGVVTSLIRIAINNLAGVPSIVYGMFGLGFFCYTLGAYVDGGPEHVSQGLSLDQGSWWSLFIATAAGGVLASLVGMSPFRTRTDTKRAAIWVGRVLWLLTAAGVLVLLARTPYFEGFFRDKLPETPTFGGRGVLWASLTLALLTLPVVIVATEEAIAAVPQSMREGSYGCGASRWQTIRRIVIPSAMPGVMTGAILAMARGAGEVAPLMLVGAVNLAPTLPVSDEFPFLHGDRTFMHLGFHIYSLGFQSADSEATRPLVWTTTLLLITIVLALNLIAIVVRARLRRGSASAV